MARRAGRFYSLIVSFCLLLLSPARGVFRVVPSVATEQRFIMPLGPTFPRSMLIRGGDDMTSGTTPESSSDNLRWEAPNTALFLSWSIVAVPFFLYHFFRESCTTPVGYQFPFMDVVCLLIGLALAPSVLDPCLFGSLRLFVEVAWTTLCVYALESVRRKGCVVPANLSGVCFVVSWFSEKEAAGLLASLTSCTLVATMFCTPLQRPAHSWTSSVLLSCLFTRLIYKFSCFPFWLRHKILLKRQAKKRLSKNQPEDSCGSMGSKDV